MLVSDPPRLTRFRPALAHVLPQADPLTLAVDVVGVAEARNPHKRILFLASETLMSLKHGVAKASGI